ncbi:MAG: ABC transporter ATP-binding protein [Saprospiraceae bacterium]|nr:ABC transporter ATP-binding protein [Saprospiraceae bacterium]
MAKEKRNVRRALQIFSFIAPYRWYFVGGAILLVLTSGFFMLLLGITGEMANVAVGKGRFDITLNQYGIILLVIILVQGVFSYLRTVSFAIVSEKGMAEVRKRVFSKLITQNLNFVEQSRVGELTSRLTTDVEQLQTAFSITLAEFLRQIVILIVGVIVLAYLTPALSLTMLTTFPVVVIAALFFARYVRKLSKERQDLLGDSNIIVEEALHSFAVVKAFANEWYERLRYGRSVDRVVNISLRFAKIRGLFFIFVISILFGGIFFILWKGAIMVSQGDMNIGDLFTFIMFTGVIGGAIAGLGNLYTQLMTSVGASERVLDILDRDQEVTTDKVIISPEDRIQGNIRFDHLSFSYPSRPEVEVLKDIHFEVEKGSTVALVGQSGSGKSTIAKLILGFYPSDSRLLIDEKPLDEYDITSYRHQVAYVPQEVLLFGGTIRENILYGRTDATEEEIVEAAKLSHCWEFIEQFPDGLETLIGDRGIQLSGGQRQRVAIARAMLRNPAILILDEATSSLDAESESKVQDALNTLMRGRTSIVIAHRLATIKEVDNIYVLESGRIVEQGRHNELMVNSEGIYSNLAKLQFN